MSIAIRYHSKFGHTAKMAEIIGELTDAIPQTVDVPLVGPVDTLYLGCGVFLGKIDSSVGKFIQTIVPGSVKRVVCFGSSAIIKSPVPMIRSLLRKQGIDAEQLEFTCRGSMGPLHRGHPNADDLKHFRQFIQSTL